MDRRCAWCGRDMPPSSVPSDAPGRVSHGICSACAGELMAGTGTPILDFLQTLDHPAILLDGDRVVGAANAPARDLIRGDPATGRRVGLVFECVHAIEESECGLSIHCSGCAIRRAVEHTHRTGEPRSEPATLRRVAVPGPEDVVMRIETERVGDRVLVRIHDPDTMPASG